MKLEWVEAPPGDAAAVISAELAHSRGDGHNLIVYVGATWCEPCRYFHDAVNAHKLDARFPYLRIIAFDADRDGERLARAGYATRLIPSFAIPAPDGRASGKHTEGSIKGPGAVDDLAPRLEALLR